MGIPVGELQRRVSSVEFAEYWAFAELEPFGPEREDLRTGIVASTIANANRDKKRRSRPYAPEEFMPRWERPSRDEPEAEEYEGGGEVDDEGPDQEELAEKIARVFAGFGGGPPGTVS